MGADMSALSCVRRPEDIAEARAIRDACGRRCPIIAKIEKPEAIACLEQNIQTSNGIMVARGDLGVEMGPEVVPMLQKRAIELANEHSKLVITATQMLDSMIRNPRPTRAEASDVANAVLDGSDAVMLSGETAAGAQPIAAVATMDKIIRTTEQAPRFWRQNRPNKDLDHTTNAIAKAAVGCTESLAEVRGIITYTGSGGIARFVSDYRPRVPIYALTPNPATFQSLALYWGVIPVLFSPSSNDGESIFIDMDQTILRRALLERGDRVVVTFGHPILAHKSVNLLKLHLVGESLPEPQGNAH
jgi:pyruvate kinase